MLLRCSNHGAQAIKRSQEIPLKR